MNVFLKKISAAARARAPAKVRAETPPDLETVYDLPYVSPDGTALSGDLYRPANRAEPLPAAVMVHGGGLFSGSKESNRAFCIRLARQGFLVFAVEYRLIDAADGFHEIADVYAALCFLQEHLEAYGGDPRQVFLLGESAGAFLSIYAAAALHSEPLRRLIGCPPLALSLRGLVCFSGMYYTTRMDMIGLTYRKDLYGRLRHSRAVMRRMNPEHPEIVSALPPVLMTGSKADYLRGYTLRYAKALRAQGHACELLYYPEGKHLTHAFPSLQPELSESREILERLVDWARELSVIRSS